MVTVFSLNLHACSFAINKSWGIQSNAFDKSIITIPAKKFSSRAFFQCFISLIKTWFELLIHEYKHKSTQVITNQHEYDTNQHKFNTSQYASIRVRHKSTGIITSTTRDNTSQLDQETIIAYRSFNWKSMITPWLDLILRWVIS